MHNKFQKLEKNVIQWAEDRGIYEHSTASAQVLKAISEVGELADAVVKGDEDGLKDAIGDIVVCLINVAHMEGLTLEQCLTAAWEEIKDRRGYVSESGAFIKEK